MSAWIFSGLTIMLLFSKPFTIASDSDCKVFFNSATVFAMTDKELSLMKLYTDALETKKNEPFIEKLNRISPVMEP